MLNKVKAASIAVVVDINEKKYFLLSQDYKNRL